MSDLGRPSEWTQEAERKLRILQGEGLSASRIAAKLGGGITRNAVIGKLHRLGIAGEQYTVWTDANTARLRELWDQRLSFRKIADALGVSRNTVMGKAKRLGLAETNPRTIPRPERAKRQSTAQGLTRAARVVRKRAIETELRTNYQLIEPPKPVEFLALTFGELKRKSCRYPRGEGTAIRFCGQPKTRGSYCGWCYDICHESRERRPSPFINKEAQNSLLPEPVNVGGERIARRDSRERAAST